MLYNVNFTADVNYEVEAEDMKEAVEIAMIYFRRYRPKYKVEEMEE